MLDDNVICYNVIYVASISAVLIFSFKISVARRLYLLVIIFRYQIFSMMWCIWNITPPWRTLTISLNELASKFTHSWACWKAFVSPFLVYLLSLTPSFQTSNSNLIKAAPNTGCFLHWWPLLGVRKSAPKKLKSNFFSKTSSIL